MDVFSLPFIIGSEDRLRAALTGPLGEEWAAMPKRRLQDAGLLDHGAAATGQQHPPDPQARRSQGLEDPRHQQPVFLQTFRTLGANPVGLDSAEMYLALQQKTVDGADNAATDIVNLKLTKSPSTCR
jgi:C4-dicarboxylate-binding protein DctP